MTDGVLVPAPPGAERRLDPSLQEIYEYLAQEVSKKSRAVGGNQHPMLKGELEGILPLTKTGKRN